MTRNIMEIGLEELQKKLTKEELAHIVFFYLHPKNLNKKTVLCYICERAFKKLGVYQSE